MNSSKLRLFEGTGVALITPFTESGDVDHPALRRLVQHVSQSGGVDYLVALGSTGEAATLNTAEKRHILDTVLDENGGRLPIVVGMGGNDTRALLAAITAFDFKGVAGLLSQSPHYNKPSQQGILAHFTAIAEASPVPVCLYNVPGRTASNMTVDTTLALADVANIAAIKEASGNVEQVSEIARQAPVDFIVTSGDDPLTLPMMSVGARGVISVAANVAPLHTAAIVNAVLAGDWHAARKAHFALAALIPLLFQEGNPTGAKAACAHLGICTPNVRMPLTPASAALSTQLAQQLEELGVRA